MPKGEIFREYDITVLKDLLYGAAISTTDMEGSFRGPDLVKNIYGKIMSENGSPEYMAIGDNYRKVLEKYKSDPETLKTHLTTALMYLAREDAIVSKDPLTPEDLVAIFDYGNGDVVIGSGLVPDQLNARMAGTYDVGLGPNDLRN